MGADRIMMNMGYSTGDLSTVLRTATLPFKVIILLTLCLNISGCTTTMPQSELHRKMREEPAPMIIDVRSQGEYESDHQPGAVHIPFYAVGSGLKERGVAKDDQIILYCEHGPRAGLAGLALYLRGYERVYALEGHLKEWRAKGLPMKKGSR